MGKLYINSIIIIDDKIPEAKSQMILLDMEGYLNNFVLLNLIVVSIIKKLP